MILEWSEPAIDDLRSLQAYIARDSPHYARLFVERLLAAAEPLADFVEMGRVVPEMGTPNIRELIVQGYRIIYQIEAPSRVVVLTVVHGRRNLSDQSAPQRKHE